MPIPSRTYFSVKFFLFANAVFSFIGLLMFLSLIPFGFVVMEVFQPRAESYSGFSLRNDSETFQQRVARVKDYYPWEKAVREGMTCAIDPDQENSSSIKFHCFRNPLRVSSYAEAEVMREWLPVLFIIYAVFIGISALIWFVKRNIIPNMVRLLLDIEMSSRHSASLLQAKLEHFEELAEQEAERVRVKEEERKKEKEKEKDG